VALDFFSTTPILTYFKLLIQYWISNYPNRRN